MGFCVNSSPGTRPIFGSLWRWALLSLSFIGLGLVCYFPALFGERIWDDHALLEWNPFVRSPWLIWETFWNPLYPYSAADYFRPLQNVSYLADYLVWGKTHVGAHVTNVLLHAAAAVLLCALLCRILPRIAPVEETRLVLWAAGGTSLVWLMHPMHHAAVAYVAGRADSLAALLSLAGWLLYEGALLRPPSPRRVAGFLGAALFGFLALYAKEIAVAWMAVFLFYRLGFAPPSTVRLRFFTLFSVFLIVAGYLWHRSQIPLTSPGASAVSLHVWDRLSLSLSALGDYLRILFWPQNLHMERSLTAPSLAGVSPAADTNLLSLYGSIALLLLGFLTTRKSAWQRFWIFCAGWFAIGFLPISNLFPLKAQVAEHWIYLASIGALIPVGALFVTLFQLRPKPTLVAACAVLMILGGVTHEQSRTWVTEENFFRTTIARGGDTAKMSWGLAAALEKRGASADAEQLLRLSIERFPQAGLLRLSLAGLQMSGGRLPEAEKILDGLKNSGANFPDPWSLELAWIRLRSVEGKLIEALALTEQALTRHEAVWALQRSRVVLLCQLAQREQAQGCLEGAVQKQPWNSVALSMLGQMQLQNGELGRALVTYQRLARLDIRDQEARKQISVIAQRL